MWRFILTGILFALTIWLLLYINEVGTKAPSIWGPIIYFAVLLCPSFGVWVLIWAFKQWAVQRSVGPFSAIYSMVASAATIGVGSILMISEKPSLGTVKPGFSALIAAIFVYGLVFFLVALICFPSTKQHVLYNNLLGQLAVGSTIAFWGVDVLVYFGKRFGWEHTVTLGVPASLFLDSWFLVTILIAFLCLLNVSRAQFVLGIVAFLGLASLVLFSRVGIFFSVWLVGPLFWPFVILSTLAAEAIVFRIILSKPFAQIVGT